MDNLDVLLIEDNENDVLLLKNIAEKVSIVGINIVVGKSLLEGKRILAEENFDVVLLDLSLPDSFELSALEDIVQSFPELPVVILTGLDDQETSFLAIQMGAQDYLIKGQVNEQSLLRALVFAIQRKQKEQQLQYLATHDHLTTLPSRWLFNDRLRRGINRAHRKTDNLSLAVLFVDFDNFKDINDSYGHSAGDAVLSTVAARLKNRLRKNDTVSRIGGDEFAIILEGIAEEHIGVKVAGELLDLINLPIEINNHTITIDASIGISFYPHHGEDVDMLLEKADLAMYKAKDSESKIQVYDGEGS
jgi:diguanylate cyclase (GGDEF)-like protein